MRLRLLICSVVLVGCAATPWEKHKEAYQQALAAQNYEVALEEQRWMMERAFSYAPPEEQGPKFEMDRQLDVARLAGRLGNVDEAVTTLREALQTDPNRYREILEVLDGLPLSPLERRRLNEQFRWNLQTLLPSLAIPAADEMPCWSYAVREIRIRSDEVYRGLGKSERRITYDVRTWRFDDGRRAWRPDGDWLTDAGAEVQLTDQPPRPRFQAVEAANGGFLAEGPLPPCHLQAWQGPFDQAHNQLFVTQDLP